MYSERRMPRDQVPELPDEERYNRHEIFEMMVNRVSEIIILFTVDDGTVSYVSPNIDRLLGISASELKEDFSRLSATAVEPQELYTEAELLHSAKEEPDGKLRARVHQRTGETRWFQEFVLRGRFKDSKKFLLRLSDRTSEVIAREQLEQALSIAKSANEGKSAFLANMSHDIRTPMNAIIGFAHLLEQEWQDSDKVREYAGKISVSSKYLLSQIDDLLDMSRLESGKAIVNNAEFSLGEWLEELCAGLRPQLQAKNLNFELQVEDLRTNLLVADKVRLAQILTNILDNSIKYTREGGTINFTITQLEQTSRKFSRLRFEVTDTGIGMSPQFQKHIFEPFTREKNTTLGGVAGMGLGLAIAKNLVDLLGGTIHVQSEQGVGSTFTVELELQIAEREADEQSGEEPGGELSAAGIGAAVQTVLSGLHILAAEDNELNAEILSELLAIEGATCDVAENGQIALEMFEASEPGFYDLILLDIQMPVMDGYQAARAIRASKHPRAKQIPIAAMTANAFAEDVEAALAAGMDAHVAKPADLGILKNAVFRILKKYADQ